MKMKKHTYIIALALIVTILVGVNVMLLKIGMNSAISEAGKSYKKTKEKNRRGNRPEMLCLGVSKSGGRISCQ